MQEGKPQVVVHPDGVLLNLYGFAPVVFCDGYHHIAGRYPPKPHRQSARQLVVDNDNSILFGLWRFAGLLDDAVRAERMFPCFPAATVPRNIDGQRLLSFFLGRIRIVGRVDCRDFWGTTTCHPYHQRDTKPPDERPYPSPDFLC